MALLHPVGVGHPRVHAVKSLERFGRRPETGKVFLRYCMTGGIGTAAQYLILVVGVHMLGMPVVFSSLGSVVGAFINYFINYHYTFESRQSHLSTMYRFFGVALIGFILNTVIMGLCIHHLQAHYLLAQCLSTGTVLVWGFAVNLIWTFRRKTDAV
ncbi:MAG: GtrA family protein [Nitrospiraceae bacterium]